MTDSAADRQGRIRSWPCASGKLIALAPLLLVISAALTPQAAIAADYYNGRDVYQMHCQTCHGADGKSMIPGTPDFSTGDTLFRPDSDLFKQIRQGKDTMPAYRGLLDDDEIRDVIAFLRSLQK